MKQIIIAVALIGGLSACGNSEAEEAVKARLRDPASAEFAAIGGTGPIVCGFVNARNGYGGMTGNRKFAYNRDTKAIYIDDGTASGPNHDLILQCNNTSSEYLRMGTEEMRATTDELRRLTDR